MVDPIISAPSRVSVEAPEGPHVLVVGKPGGACEPFLRQLLEPGKWRVSYCYKVSKAEDFLVEQGLDLVISDLQMEDGCGLNLLALREDLRSDFPVLLAASPETAVREMASSPLRWIRAPLDTNALGSLVAAERERLERVGRSRLRVGDYLYAAAVTRQTTTLYFQFEGGDEAVMEVVEGELWSCSHEEADGWSPLVPLLAVEPKMARSDRLGRPPAVRRLQLDTQEWILRVLGERTDPAFLEEGPAVVVQESPEEDFDSLFVAGVAASLARDYAGALRAFERADQLSPGDSRVKFNLERMRQKLGLT